MKNFFKSTRFKIILCVLAALFAGMFIAAFTSNATSPFTSAAGIIYAPVQKAATFIAEKTADWKGSFVSSSVYKDRIEELERQISIMKLSSADQKAPPVLTEQAPPKQESVQSAPTPVSTALPKSTVEVEARVYSDWGEVLDRIAELKRPLYSGLVSATVHKLGRGNITIATSDFFAKRLLSNEADMNMIRGVIAEHEGISASEITLEIKVKGVAPTVGVLSEIENALK